MKALILVDIQNDFCPGGNLAVSEGDKIILLVNALQKNYDLVVATQDFHPITHKSFASNNPGKAVGSLGELNGQVQVMWPDHCVQGTKGAEFHPALDMSKVAQVFPKGTNPEVDSYSGFFDNDHKSTTGLGEYLKAQGVTAVDVVGLALDYCVKATALDAQKLGFITTVIPSATKAVNLNPGDDLKAIAELQAAGVRVHG
jgi:nicotinamidase/pyrazinamidase